MELEDVANSIGALSTAMRSASTELADAFRDCASDIITINACRTHRRLAAGFRRSIDSLSIIIIVASIVAFLLAVDSVSPADYDSANISWVLVALRVSMPWLVVYGIILVALQLAKVAIEGYEAVQLSTENRLSLAVLAKVALRLLEKTVPHRRIVADVRGIYESGVTILATLAPVISVLWPRSPLAGIVHSVRYLDTVRERAFNRIRSWLPVSWSDHTATNVTWGILSAFMALPTGFALWRTVRSKSRKMAVVPKKRQEFSANIPDGEPISPADMSAVRAFPASPRFRGSELVRASVCLVRTSSYAGTAFRVANNLVTAGHCLTTHEGKQGIWVYDPVEKNHCWAPIEAKFRKRHGDGIAVCSLPNSPYFLSLKSAPIATIRVGRHFVATYTLESYQNGPAQWSISFGSANVTQGVDMFEMDSTVLPGSSGGPVINTDGTIVGVTFAESQTANYAFKLSKDIVDFLTKGGGAKSEKSTGAPTTEDLAIESMSIDESEESSEECEEMPQTNGAGQTPPKKRKPKKSEGTPGSTGPGAARRPKKKGKEHPSPPDEHDHLPSGE
uniref:Polyprotein n=1 Tax=Alphapermutotetravirus sp. TaxID=2766833 RepID=A0A7G8LSG1_9VIRU|nr:polyprotein [Alphapermutotetravirus sp.]